jgi:Ran GTPase-activating protein (RanGAP) involved in mRNA processing and transport
MSCGTDTRFNATFRFGLMTIKVERCSLVDFNSSCDTQSQAKAEVSFQQVIGNTASSSIENFHDTSGNIPRRSNVSKCSKERVIFPILENSRQILEYLEDCQCQNITELSVSSDDEDATCTELQLTNLIEFLQLNYFFIHIEKLSLKGCNIGTETSAALGRLLKTIKSTLRELDLSDNRYLKGSGLTSVIEVLRTNADDNTDTATLLLENLELDQFERSSRYQLCRLDLSNTGLVGNQAGSLIASLLRNNATIQELVLANNRLGHKGIKTIAASLCENRTLTLLDVSWNNICDRGIRALMDGLLVSTDNGMTRSSIVELDLSGNDIGSAGVFRMASALLERQLRNITKLSMRSNPSGHDAVHDYAYLLQFSYTITELNLSGNNLQDNIIEIMNALQKNRDETSLRKLDISWNNITDNACFDIAKMIEGNTTLECLIVANNNITDKGITELARALFENTVLTELDIFGNNFKNLRSLCTWFAMKSSR